MWARTYLALLVIRLYLALQPSYIHPDENFQGPEVIAGMFPLPLPPSSFSAFSSSCSDKPSSSAAISGELLAPKCRALYQALD